MESKELAKVLMALERQYWNAIKNKDAKTAASLSSDPCVVVGAQGIGELDKRTLGKMLQTAGYELPIHDTRSAQGAPPEWSAWKTSFFTASLGPESDSGHF